MVDFMENLSTRATAIIGGGGTIGSLGLSHYHLISGIAVALVTILVLIPTGITNWKKLLVRNDTKETDEK
jgi:glucose dehydrogenase